MHRRMGGKREKDREREREGEREINGKNGRKKCFFKSFYHNDRGQIMSVGQTEKDGVYVSEC